MLTIAYYFLQVILCSALLMGYYWLVLRNKRFHQYNRFYLLGAAILSWVVPLVKITLHTPVSGNSSTTVTGILSAVALNNTQLEERISQTGFDRRELVAYGIYFTVSAILLFALVRAFIRLYRLLKANACKNVGDVYLILTQAKGTPFSFFRYIFWNEEIDIRSEAGKQILQHELTHVRQKHSFDKLFIQVMLIGGWFNPFFWLLRREMEMIHEFIADKKAVSNGDTAALAQMLLTAAYPQQKFMLTHPFFFSPVKRRLLMLADNKNPRFSYIRRLVVMPLLAIVIVLFAFRSQAQRAGGELSVASVVNNYREDLRDAFIKDQQPVALDAPFVIAGEKVGDYVQKMEDLKYAPYLLSRQEKNVSDTQPIIFKPVANFPVPEPVFVVNGQRISKMVLGTIDPNMIDAISVYKGESAVAQYGADAANGVIDITMKNTGRAGLTFTFDEGKLIFPNISAVVKDFNLSVVKSRKVYVKEIIYQGEEKTRVIEETHITSTNEDGVFTVKVGAGKAAPSSKLPEQIDVSRGPFYVNVKVAIEPQGSPAGFNVEDSYVDLGFSQIAMKEKEGFLKTDAATGNVYWGDLKPGRGSASTNNPVVTLRGAGSKTQETIPAAGSAPQAEKTLNEIAVISYGTSDAAGKRQAKTEPHFPGGQVAWEKYLMHNLNQDVLKNNKAPFGKYTVEVSFMIGRDGSISDVRALNDPGYGTKTEAERIIGKGPKWVAATDEKGHPVNYRQKQPVTFIYVDEAATGNQPAELRNSTAATAAGGAPAGTGAYKAEVFGKMKTAGEQVKDASQPAAIPNTAGVITGGTFSGDSKVVNPPSFPGGLQAWSKYVERNIKKDEPAAKGAAPGKYTVVITFTVGIDGAISNVSALNDPGYGTREQALQLLEKGPRWVPATAGKQPVSMRHQISITFYVQGKAGTALRTAGEQLKNTGVTALLKKLPGVQEQDGIATVNGEQVKNVYVDGKQVLNTHPL